MSNGITQCYLLPDRGGRPVIPGVVLGVISDLFVQLLGCREDLERAKSENQALSDCLQTSRHDVSQLQQRVRELEHSQSVTQEKLHTCQQEVSARPPGGGLA